MRIITTIEGEVITEHDDGSVHFRAKAAIDADGANGQFGAPPSYAPSNFSGKKLDVLANAGGPGNWYGVVTDNGQPNGTPIVQGRSDPCPGAYISATALFLPGPDGESLPRANPFKYVDAATVPYIVVPPAIRNGVKGVVMGCLAHVTNTLNGKHIAAVVGDIGPRKKIGEISCACASAIGLNPSPISGGVDEHVIEYVIFPGVPAIVNGETYNLQPA